MCTEGKFSFCSHGVTPCPAKSKPADKPDEDQAPAKAPMNSGPACRPPWVTDPGFADRYHPDKTSTVVTQHKQPVQPTPMQNRSSIMQAAQQNPADSSGRTPLCAAVLNPAVDAPSDPFTLVQKLLLQDFVCVCLCSRGRYVVALGRSWHPEEFTCCQCKRVLDEGGFFEEKGSIYCTKCYDNRYSPNCAKCKKKITGEIMHALKMTYHVQCFLCAACKMPIRNQAFYMEEGEPYCERGERPRPLSHARPHILSTAPAESRARAPAVFNHSNAATSLQTSNLLHTGPAH
ncbi:PDZ and LIM domain protein 7 [Labeo rohita]|uniref:PDZ and LIM domain protein 7 n=1 Tax=Labeo rohita TaxID=84645 RepID=A0ABQ8M2A2_LABRO|nr:PDZ and LIM domain protein 7 [Labeo rohita]